MVMPMASRIQMLQSDPTASTTMATEMAQKGAPPAMPDDAIFSGVPGGGIGMPKAPTPSYPRAAPAVSLGGAPQVAPLIPPVPAAPQQVQLPTLAQLIRG